MKSVVAIVLLLLSNYCYSDWAHWSDTDKAMFVASNVAITADWMTTRYYSKHKSDFPNHYETNRFLGKYPSTDSVDIYFVGMIIANYYITDWLPSDWRGFYLGVRTGSHGAAAMSNMNIGWKLQF